MQARASTEWHDMINSRPTNTRYQNISAHVNLTAVPQLSFPSHALPMCILRSNSYIVKSMGVARKILQRTARSINGMRGWSN